MGQVSDKHISPVKETKQLWQKLKELLFGRQQAELQNYTSETLTYIKTVKAFCDTQPEWTSQRESERKSMEEIRKCTGNIVMNILTQHFGLEGQELEKKLGAVLKDTLKGLKELQSFLDAVERLAVTSLDVFKNPDISFMLEGKTPESVQSYILTARSVSLLLSHFKRDDEAFFLSKLHNLDVLDAQLHKYICITKGICSQMRNPSLKPSLSMEGSAQNVTLSQLTEIRMDDSFRLTFLFDGKHQRFLDTFSKRHSRLLNHLSDLERPADQLDE
ncbi:hypothetical protein MHYP_G00146430 [Metynnis hypsauchen]